MSEIPPLGDDTKIVQSTSLPHGEIDDELMALDASNGEILGLDKIGTQIWRLAREPIDVGNIVQRLSAEYDADEATIRSDVYPFIAELLASGLLRIVP